MRGSPVFRRTVLAAAGLSLLLVRPILGQTTSQDLYGDEEISKSQVRPDLALGSGARALGMGGAFLARADDASAASWNPAGLSYLRRPELSLAGIYTSSDTDGYADEVLNRTDHLSAKSPDFVSIAYPFEIRSVSGAAQLSFQRVIHLSGHRDIVRPRADLTLDTDGGFTTGGFDVLSAGLGVQVTQNVRVGATLNRWMHGFKSTTDTARAEGTLAHHETDFSMSGWNVNAGVIWTPWEDLNLGLVGKTPFRGNVTLVRERRDFASAQAPPSIKGPFTHDDVVVQFPASAGVGASWRVTTPLTMSLDVTRTLWSRAWIRNYYDITPNQGIQSSPDRLPFPSFGPQQNTQQIRLGFEYVVVLEHLKWPLRWGYYNDRQYYPAESLTTEKAVTPRFNAFTLGTGISAGNFLVDVAYVGEFGLYSQGVTAPPRVDFHVSSHRIFMSFIFRPGNY